MSLNRYDKAKDANQKAIVAGLRQCGITVEILDRPCDLLCGWRGVNTLLEVKADEKLMLTESQQKFFINWRGQFNVVTTLEQAVEIICGPSAVQGA